MDDDMSMIFETAKNLKEASVASDIMKKEFEDISNFYKRKALESCDPQEMLYSLKLTFLSVSICACVDEMLENCKDAIDKKEDEIIRGEEV